MTSLFLSANNTNRKRHNDLLDVEHEGFVCEPFVICDFFCFLICLLLKVNFHVVDFSMLAPMTTDGAV